MSRSTIFPTSFTIERRLPGPPQKVFAAWADPAARRRWSDCHPDALENDFALDFRPGGEGLHRVVYADGAVQVVRMHHFDVVEPLRAVYAYEITLDGRRLSVSLVTVEFRPEGEGALMAYGEQLAYLDGHYDIEERIHGTHEGFDRLELELAGGGAPH
jgi:uncharacterized protein YndB with AHSA1/START domain